MRHRPIWQSKCVCLHHSTLRQAVAYFPSSNVAVQLIEKGENIRYNIDTGLTVYQGLASVVRHKRDDEDRSPDYDSLMAAEAA